MQIFSLLYCLLLNASMVPPEYGTQLLVWVHYTGLTQQTGRYTLPSVLYSVALCTFCLPSLVLSGAESGTV